jgi:hypothetical protein
MLGEPETSDDVVKEETSDSFCFSIECRIEFKPLGELVSFHIDVLTMPIGCSIACYKVDSPFVKKDWW